jgi:catechol 2,3-dioxygenase-like lactoylglutathione lyase family enzyme
MKFICCLLAVDDVARSRRFYEEILGQKVKMDFGENITFEGDFALHKAAHYRQLIDGKEICFGGNTGELYFEDNALEDLASRLEAEGVALVHPLREQPWRQQVIRFYDPDRHIIEVGESMEHLVQRLKAEGMSQEEILGATGLPEAFVAHCLQSAAEGGA